MTFGARLRQARETRGVSLRHIADVTKLSVRTLEALERGKMGYLPGGIYRRSIVRSYARLIGLDPEAALHEFLAEYPDDLPPPPGAPTPKTSEPSTTAEASGTLKAWRGFAFRAGSFAMPLVSAFARRGLLDR
jgi:cytoskeletal protein RodZ